jgi:hypothetical protein
MTAGMRRLVYPFLVALLTLVAAGARAQTGITGTTATATPQQAIQQGMQVKRDGKALKNDPLIYVTRDICVQDSLYEFSVKYSTAVPVVELWVGVGGEDCSSVASRQRTTTAATPACKLVASHGSSINPIITAHATELFNINSLALGNTQVDDGGTDTSADAGTDELDGGAADADTNADAGTSDAGEEADSGVTAGPTGCDNATSLAYKVYFIPLMQPTNPGASKAYEAITTGYGYSTLVATFTLFTELPAAPSGLSPLSGESQISVKFTPLAGALTKTAYRAYFDWGSAEDQECGSGQLVANGPPPDPDTTIEEVSANAGKATLKNLDDKNIEINSLVAASVVTIDPAGNESLLSEPVCIKREETTSFLDRCNKEPDCQLNSCSLRPAARATGLLSLSALLALGIALFVRRRHV